MYIACRDYLVNQLTAAGADKIFTGEKKLATSQATRFGAILFIGETFSRCDTKRLFHDEEGVKKKRRKVFNRKMTFMVMIGETVDTKCEAIFQSFIDAIDRGIMIDGNFTGIEVEDADWIEEGDNILRAKLAVVLKVIFEGGVYKDTKLADLGKAALGVRIEKVPALGKENHHG